MQAVKVRLKTKGPGKTTPAPGQHQNKAITDLSKEYAGECQLHHCLKNEEQGAGLGHPRQFRWVLVGPPPIAVSLADGVPAWPVLRDGDFPSAPLPEVWAVAAPQMLELWLCGPSLAHSLGQDHRDAVAGLRVLVLLGHLRGGPLPGPVPGHLGPQVSYCAYDQDDDCTQHRAFKMMVANIPATAAAAGRTAATHQGLPIVDLFSLSMRISFLVDHDGLEPSGGGKPTTLYPSMAHVCR